MDNITKNTAKNTALLYLLTCAKFIFPLLTLPYLTRVLTPEGYGAVAYVKSCMSYMQIIIDFGFILSAVKDIVKAENNYEKIGEIVGSIIIAKLLLAVVILIATIILCFIIPILKNYIFFTILYVISIMITAFSMDYLFRGIEKMHIITVVFIATKGIVAILTFILIKGDGDLLLIPLMEILGNIVGVILSGAFVKKLRISIKFIHFKSAISKLKDSAVYFVSSFSGTAFTALNTLLIGIIIEDLEQVAFWSVSWQLISAVLALYAPIIDGVYPQMIQKKDLKFIGKLLMLFMPIILLGCAFCFVCADWILNLIAGAAYISSALLFKLLLIVLFFSFPSMLFGWPALGCIGKEKFVTFSTACGAVCQIVGLVLLIVIDRFTIYNVAILRGITEIVIMSIRTVFIIKYRKEFGVRQDV